uniref:Uncharacterized protein n=1 Tax=Photinus pyralis TaxID=7054 RepID=A0A1Y1MW70_PHOPY
MFPAKRGRIIMKVRADSKDNHQAFRDKLQTKAPIGKEFPDTKPEADQIHTMILRGQVRRNLNRHMHIRLVLRPILTTKPPVVSQHQNHPSRLDWTPHVHTTMDRRVDKVLQVRHNLTRHPAILPAHQAVITTNLQADKRAPVAHSLPRLMDQEAHIQVRRNHHMDKRQIHAATITNHQADKLLQVRHNNRLPVRRVHRAVIIMSRQVDRRLRVPNSHHHLDKVLQIQATQIVTIMSHPVAKDPHPDKHLQALPVNTHTKEEEMSVPDMNLLAAKFLEQNRTFVALILALHTPEGDHTIAVMMLWKPPTVLSDLNEEMKDAYLNVLLRKEVEASLDYLVFQEKKVSEDFPAPKAQWDRKAKKANTDRSVHEDLKEIEAK